MTNFQYLFNSSGNWIAFRAGKYVFDASGNWLGGQWLGGKYWSVNEIAKYTFKPSSPSTRFVELHLFTEENSIMTLYIDEVSVTKK